MNLTEAEREHVEACRRHLEVGAEVRLSGQRALLAIIDRLAPKVTCDHVWECQYDHNKCTLCGSVRTDSGWGIAKFKEFKSYDAAKFYRAHGRHPE